MFSILKARSILPIRKRTIMIIGVTAMIVAQTTSENAARSQDPAAKENASAAATDEQISKTAEELEKAKTLRYTIAFFSKVEGEGGEKPRYQANGRAKSEHRFPNLYRETNYNDKGEIQLVSIVDTEAKKYLLLDMIGKRAVWMKQPMNVYGPGSPLEMLAGFVRKISGGPVRRRDVGDRQADVYRLKGFDLWMDVETHRLVAFCRPGIDVSDEELKAATNQRAFRPGRAQIRHNIEYGMALDDSLFDFSIPEGFELREPPTSPRGPLFQD